MICKAIPCTHESSKYPESFKETVRTQTVASGRGYCPQTAHLESGTSAVSFETQPTPRTMGAGRMAIQPHAGFTSMPESLVSLVYAMWRSPGTGQSLRCSFRIFYVWMMICKATFTDPHEVAVLVNIKGPVTTRGPSAES